MTKAALIYFFGFISLLSLGADAVPKGAPAKTWYTYPNSWREKYQPESGLSPAFHLPQQQQKVKWEVYLGFAGKEIAGYEIPTYDLSRDGRLKTRKTGLKKSQEVWIENLIARSGIHYYRVTSTENIESFDPDGVPTFKSNAEFFWVSGQNVRRKVNG